MAEYVYPQDGDYLTPAELAIRVRNITTSVQNLFGSPPGVVDNLPLDSLLNRQVFYTPTQQLYSWNADSESWRLLVKPIFIGLRVENIAIENGANTPGSMAQASYIDGPAAGYLEWQYISSASDTTSMSTSTPNVFIRGGSGSDAIQVTTGRNVLDGGLGSNFLVGGNGKDTFFTDARGGVTWSTLSGFGNGDAATIWGFVAGTSQFTWEAEAGAEGSKGATLRVDLGNDGSVDASVTFAGLSLAQASQLQVSTGTQEAGAYLSLQSAPV